MQRVEFADDAARGEGGGVIPGGEEFVGHDLREGPQVGGAYQQDIFIGGRGMPDDGLERLGAGQPAGFIHDRRSGHFHGESRLQLFPNRVAFGVAD